MLFLANNCVYLRKLYYDRMNYFLKKAIYFLTVCLAAAALASCSSIERQRLEKGQTLLIYMAANNNLAGNAISNIEDLDNGYLPKKNDKNVLLVYRDIGGQNPELIRVYKDNYGKPETEIIESYEPHNSASPEVIHRILNRSYVLFPSKINGLILWSHATGWLPEGFYGSNLLEADPYMHLVKSFGSDNSDPEETNIDELKDLLPIRYDYIIFDCCFMGGIETAYELRNCADYIIAAPTEILAMGFPYGRIISPLFMNYGENALKTICGYFFSQYSSQEGIMQSATISMYRTEGLERLASMTKEIIDGNREKIQGMDISRMQPYFRMNDHWFYDLGCFMRELCTPVEFNEYRNLLNEVVVYKEATPMFLNSIVLDPDNVFGISTYLPAHGNKELDIFYSRLDWNKATGLVDTDQANGSNAF